MAQLSRPQLRTGGLSGKVYVITHGKFVKGKNGVEYLDATRKYDVTEQFEALAAERGYVKDASAG